MKHPNVRDLHTLNEIADRAYPRQNLGREPERRRRVGSNTLPSQPGRKHHYIPVFYRLGNKRQNKETTNLQDFPEIQHRLMDTQQLEFRIVDGLQHFERYHRTLGYGLQCGG